MSLEHSLGIKFAGFGLSKAKADTSKLPMFLKILIQLNQKTW